MNPIIRFGFTLSLSLCACASIAQEQKRERPAPPVQVSEARMMPMAPTVMVSGTIWSQQEAAVPAEVNGRLVWVAEVGSQVKWGDALAKMDDTMHRLRVAENRAALQRETAKLNFLDNELGRIRELSRQDYAAKSQLEKMQLDRDVVVSELAVSRAKLASDEETLKRFTVRAPFAGVVTARTKREGEWVTSGDTVVSFSNPAALEVRAHVPAESVGHIKLGQEVNVVQGEQIRRGKVRALVPVGDQQSLLFDVRVAVEAKEWRAGQTVRLSVPMAASSNVLAVSRDALVLRRTGTYVFTVGSDGVAQRVDVETGIASGDMIAIKGNINPGDRVVVRGSERLRPGQTVNIAAGN